MMKEQLTADIYKSISECDEIVIYGTGRVAERCYRKLQTKGLSDKVICYTQTSKPSSNIFCGIPLYEISDLLSNDRKNNRFYMISVGNESFLNEIAELLEKNGNFMYADGWKIAYENNGFTREGIKRHDDAIKTYLINETGDMSKSDGITATHVTYPFGGNAGDTYLSYCLRRFLGFEKWNLVNVTEPVTWQMIERINSTDVLIIGGGGLFLPDTNENKNSGWQWDISDELLEKINVPIFVFSVGFNYFYGQEISPLFISSVNKLTEKAVFLGLRNTGSIETICDIIPNNLGNKVIYQPCVTTFANKFLTNVKKKCPVNFRKIVALNMAFDRSNSRFGINKELICNEIAQAIKYIGDKGFEIVYVAHCEDDFLFLQYLDRYEVNYKNVDLSCRLPEEIIEFYNGCRTVIGMRGHAQMIPFGLGCNIITLSTHNKMRWFLEDIGFMDMYVDLCTTKEIKKQILNVFEYIESYSNEIRNRQEEALDYLYRSSLRNKEVIYSYMNKN